jgi:hypothetical protein
MKPARIDKALGDRRLLGAGLGDTASMTTRPFADQVGPSL